LTDILLITPPFTQLNTPYPATTYLKGFLNTRGIRSFQIDLGIEVINELFTPELLRQVFESTSNKTDDFSDNASRIYSLKQAYINTIPDVISFLQGNNASLARKICNGDFLPQAERFNQIDDLDWAFGTMGFHDRAKHLCTLYLEDLSDFIIEQLDPHFGFSRYAERLGRSANTFDELHSHLSNPATFIDQITLQLLEKHVQEHNPKLLCFSIPFPGNLYSAFRCAGYIRQKYPEIKIAMGGGFPNTELRSITDPEVFKFFDFISLDDGERPIELIYQWITQGQLPSPELKRTFILENNLVKYNNLSKQPDYKQHEVGTPDYSDLNLHQYLSVIEVTNPMHSLWSDGRWNKLTLAHGCYWGKCTFCDVSLDYIQRYEPLTARLIVDRMEEIIHQTGERGFHFVDEAAPPALMRELAIEILRRELSVIWWTNIRFEKSFTLDLCRLLKASGCIAVSGGLEVASDRLLKLIKKGVSVDQVARVMRNFTEADLMVHAYLMYGYPTQTVQETVDSLEMVRQLFEMAILQSGFWHQFALTAHSPIGQNPEDYNITPIIPEVSFALNDLEFSNHTGIDHNKFSFGLKKSLYNYMHGIGYEFPLQEWFDFKIPKTTIPPDYIESCLEHFEFKGFKKTTRVIWLGGTPLLETIKKGKKIKTQLTFHLKTDQFTITMPEPEAKWLHELLNSATPQIKEGTLTLDSIKQSFEREFDDFEIFWYSKGVNKLRQHGLLEV